MIDAIELEVHFGGDYTKEILDLFRKYGFRDIKAKTSVNVYILTR